MRRLQGTCVVVLIILLHGLHAQGTYMYDLPVGRVGFSSDIILTCTKDGNRVEATFWKRPSLVAGPETILTGLEYSFTLTQQLEAYYCCSGPSAVGPESECKPLVGKRNSPWPSCLSLPSPSKNKCIILTTWWL